MRFAVAVLRLVVAACIVAAVVASATVSIGSGRIAPFDFGTYFTTQVDVLAVVGLVASAIRLLRGGEVDGWIDRVRLAATTYLVVVALGRAVLVPPWQTTVGYPMPAINVFLNLIVCLYVIADWVLAPDRAPLELGSLRWLVLYPVLWNAMTVIRGIATGWTPYPLLDPTESPLRIILFLAATCVGTLVAGTLAIAASRLGRGGGSAVPAQTARS